jgi:hypothetical protein
VRDGAEVAVDVDVVPVTVGGAMFELTNLRLLCQSHHHRIEHELKRQRRAKIIS